jgi:hypothetical protein
MSAEDERRGGVGDASTGASGSASDAGGNPPELNYEEYFHAVAVAGGEKDPAGWAKRRELEVGSDSPFDITESLRELGGLDLFLARRPAFVRQQYVRADTTVAPSVDTTNARVAVLPLVNSSSELKAYTIVTWAQDNKGNLIRSARSNYRNFSQHPTEHDLTTTVSERLLQEVPNGRKVNQLNQVLAGLPRLRTA